MSDQEQENIVVAGYEEAVTLASKSIANIPIKWAMPGLVILVHGVNDVGEAFPYQERGLCAGLNERLDRKDLMPGEWTLPVEKKKGEYTAADVHPDPDKVYFQRKPDAGTSPVIPFFWGYRAVADRADTKQRHGQYIDEFGNRIDKRFGKNGGPFANATTNIPDMFGKGFVRNLTIRAIDPRSGTHPLMSAPPRNYMVLAAQRLAALIRIIRKKSPNEAINIVAHSQGCFVTLLAHAILAKEGEGIKADTVILNNPPYSLEEPGAETIQTGAEQQQTIRAREDTLQNIIAGIITKNPATVPAFEELQKLGTVGRNWGPTLRKERDNRGKLYLYFSPDDVTVGLPNIQGIGWWGVYNEMLPKLGNRFFQRMFAMPVKNIGSNPKAPKVGTAPQDLTLHFKMNAASITVPRNRRINGEELEVPFTSDFGPAVLMNGPLDAAIAVTNIYTKKGQESILANETPAEAQARWLNMEGANSFHSSIVNNPEHSRMATAYDICIGESKIIAGKNDNYIQLLRAFADWRTNWDLQKITVPSSTAVVDPSFPPPSENVLSILYSGIDARDRDIAIENYHYHSVAGAHPGVLPSFTKYCTVEKLIPHIISETRNERKTQSELNNPSND